MYNFWYILYFGNTRFDIPVEVHVTTYIGQTILLRHLFSYTRKTFFLSWSYCTPHLVYRYTCLINYLPVSSRSCQSPRQDC